MPENHGQHNLDQQERENHDQQEFDQQVNRVGGRILFALAGAGIFAALIMSVLALTVRTSGTTTAVAPTRAPSQPSAVMSADVKIMHVTRGCHTLSVNGSQTLSPNATIRLSPGGTMKLQNNDVMPHQLVLLHGPQTQLTGAMMKQMGASGSVTFPLAGTYTFTTKPGDDYMPGITTVGTDNTLKIRVVVGPTPAAA